MLKPFTKQHKVCSLYFKSLALELQRAGKEEMNGSVGEVVHLYEESRTASDIKVMWSCVAVAF